MRPMRLLFILLAFSSSSLAQTWQDTLSLIDKTFSQYQRNNPGCQLSISRNGQVIFSKAWGMADLERNVPLTTNSILEAGSVSKQFVAASMLLLEQQGKLSLDDNVRKYIPELPDYGSPITLREMMHHTSGFRDWGDIATLSGWPRGEKFYSNDDALDIIARQKHLNNIPGAEFLYSNSNYNLFAIIIQRVSGLTLAEFTRKYIFDEAGMTKTEWRNHPNHIVPNRAIAYSKEDDQYETDMPNEYVYGNGGLLTTTEDLLKWNEYYQQGKLGSPSLLNQQLRQEPLNNGTMNLYAAGLVINTVRGWKSISHNGATASYRAYLEAFPELHLSIAILSNTSEFNINTIAAKTRAIFVADKANKPVIPKSVDLSASGLKAAEGLYRNEKTGFSFTLSVKENKIFLDKDQPLVATSANTFSTGSFELQLNGYGGSLVFFSPRDTIAITKMKPADPAFASLPIFEGRYYSPEVESEVGIEHDNGKLMIRFKPGMVSVLVPTYTDAFTIETMGAALRFLRNNKAEIIGFRVDTGRARDVEWEKQR